ncbi:RNA methyltransferase [Candidatus Bathyarchaeota archaeon]|nr:MAG: RNA methyltransferase [Candidatus Bathyarchaeota archaeon]
MSLDEFRVVLVEPSFDESIGFVARAMKNFGLSNLHLVNPRTVLGPSGRMRGGHAQDVLDSIVEHRSLKEALEGLHLSIGTTAQRSYAASNLVRKPMTPRELGHVLKNRAGTVGIVFGREGTGLTNVELGQCDATLTIPAVSEYQTLNLSHAAAIVFYELHVAAGESSMDGLASERVKKTILSFLSDSALRSGGRSAIRQREGSLLVEVLRRISEALSQTKEPEDSGTQSVVSETESGTRAWAEDTSGLPQRHDS